VANSATTASSVNTPGAIIARDASGHFAAGGLSLDGGTSIAAFYLSGVRDGFFGTPLGLVENLNTNGSSGPALRLINWGGDSIDGVLSVSSGGTGDLAVFGNASVFVSRLDTNGTWTARAYEAGEYLKAGFNQQISGPRSSITGGFNNTNRASNSLIGGGAGNTIDTNTSQSVLGGGQANTIRTNVLYAVIGGGNLNAIGENTSAAVVPGGRNNTAAGDYSLAAGGRLRVGGFFRSGLPLDGGEPILCSRGWGREVRDIGSGDDPGWPAGARRFRQRKHPCG
jgi:hypothetical protein